MEIFGAIAAAIFGFPIAIVLIGNFFWAWQQNKTKMVTLAIKPGKNNEKNPHVAEHLFSTLHGIYQSRNWWQILTGMPQISLAFEMVKKHGKIFFSVRVPEHFSDFVKNQLYSHYSDAEIDEIPTSLHDQNLASFIKKHIVFGEMELENSSLWPIKRYSFFEDKISQTFHDPLSAILLPLSQSITQHEMGGFQIAIRPFDDSKFRGKAKKVLQKISNRKFSWNRLQTAFERHHLGVGLWRKIFSLHKSIFFLFFRGKFVGKTEETSVEDVNISTSKTHEKETEHSAATDKMSRFVFETNIRVFFSTDSQKHNKKSLVQKIQEFSAPFKQFHAPYLNGLSLGKTHVNDEELFLLRWKNAFVDNQKIILNTEELATIFHFPHKTVEIAEIDWTIFKRLSPPSNLPTESEADVTLLGESVFRGKRIKFGILPDDRRRHMYIVGKTGMGKSTLLENMISSDIASGKGLAVIDPHGDLADAVLNFVPKSRTNDVIIFDPSDREFPISFNILECSHPENKNLVASGVVGVFKKMFAESWGPRLEYILRNTILALVEAGGQSLLGVLRMLADAKYRNEIIKQISDPVVLQFWNEEFGKWQPKQVAEAISPIQNKVGQFLSSSLVRNILGQSKSSFDLRFAMDSQKIVIINLSKGKIGEDVSALLGAMLITKFQLEVMGRANVAEKDRKDFYLYVDEFQNFATGSFATILSEARKYRLSLTVANQYLAQMEDEVREAIFGNVGSIVAFQVGQEDSNAISEQFGGEEILLPSDIAGLPKYTAYMRLMTHGITSTAFSVNTLPPPEFDFALADKEVIRKVSREKYASNREKVEKKILKWAWSNR